MTGVTTWVREALTFWQCRVRHSLYWRIKVYHAKTRKASIHSLTSKIKPGSSNTERKQKEVYRLKQRFPTRGSCTPRGTFDYLKGYIYCTAATNQLGNIKRTEFPRGMESIETSLNLAKMYVRYWKSMEIL